MADADSTRACPICGSAIHPKINKDGLPSNRRPATHCSKRCYWKAKDTDPARRARPRSSGARPYRDADCASCAQPFKAYQSGGTAWTVYCSYACAGAARSARAGDSAADQAAIKAIVRPEVMALLRIARYVERPRTFRVKCKTCAGTLVARRCGGLHQQVCDECTKASQAKCRRIAKAKRRAMERGAQSDQIDPIKVFARDKWRCHLCGCKAPQKLRGTHDAKAPELDHIVTLADGGTHTWGNVACACRQCNQTKGARSQGQLGLALAA